MSSLTTNGIKISVSTKYEAESSRPDRDYYAFSYKVTITNERTDTVRLLRRHWFIRDANGEMKEVEGLGVIGEQPTIAPNESHSYSSWCPIATSFGQMSGHYLMEIQGKHELFKAQVPAFNLSAEFLLN